MPYGHNYPYNTEVQLLDHLHMISVNKKNLKIIKKPKKKAKSYVRHLFFILRKKNNPSKRSFQYCFPKSWAREKRFCDILTLHYWRWKGLLLKSKHKNHFPPQPVSYSFQCPFELSAFFTGWTWVGYSCAFVYTYSCWTYSKRKCTVRWEKTKPNQNTEKTTPDHQLLELP